MKELTSVEMAVETANNAGLDIINGTESKLTMAALEARNKGFQEIIQELLQDMAAQITSLNEKIDKLSSELTTVEELDDETSIDEVEETPEESTEQPQADHTEPEEPTEVETKEESDEEHTEDSGVTLTNDDDATLTNDDDNRTEETTEDEEQTAPQMAVKKVTLQSSTNPLKKPAMSAIPVRSLNVNMSMSEYKEKHGITALFQAVARGEFNR